VFSASTASREYAPEGTVANVTGAHFPPLHVPPWQPWPQEPQLLASVPLTVTHTLLQTWVPAGLLVRSAQVPFVEPVTELAHPWQLSVQLAGQQIESRQLAEEHWSLAEQVEPVAFTAVQVPLAQKYPLTQSESAVQLALQVVVEAQTSELGQGPLVVGVTQVPEPLHVGAPVSTALEQAVAPQVVPPAP